MKKTEKCILCRSVNSGTLMRVNSVNEIVSPGYYKLDVRGATVAEGVPAALSGENFSAFLEVVDTNRRHSNLRNSAVGQTLTFTNENGNTAAYHRALSIVEGATVWSDWSKLQQNVEVGTISTFDNLTDSGVYSGVYIDGSTFMMVVINNSAVASENGRTQSISQFKNAINLDGTFSYKTRVGRGADVLEWGSWVDLGASSSSDIQDGAITSEKLSESLRSEIEKVQPLTERVESDKTALINGDTIVGLAREVYSRQGKEDKATFLARTTAGGTTVSDGVASIKQIGGNIVKNLVDGTFCNEEVVTGTYEIISDRKICRLFNDKPSYAQIRTKTNATSVVGHKYYSTVLVYNEDAAKVQLSISGGIKNSAYLTTKKEWKIVSIYGIQEDVELKDIIIRGTYEEGKTSCTVYLSNWLAVDLTEMYGAGNEPTKEECDKLFATIGALPNGLSLAQPTAFKSIGYNHWNPANVLEYKSVSAGTIIGVSGSHIAIIECLPCKTGTGENNGYVIGYGEGDGWSDNGIEVYLTPLNPLEVEGELYLQKLVKDATYGTYVPQIKGYLLVVTPTTDKLCAHFHWSGDRATTDYEPYVESSVALPVIPEMSEWGLAGIQASGIQDSVNLEKNTYTKRIDCLDLGNISYQYYSPSETYPYGFFATSIINARFSKTNALMCEKYTHGSFAADKAIMANTANNGTFYIIDSSYTDAVSLKKALEGIKLYYEITPEEYPIVTKAAPNYIGSDYGVEEFTGSKVPLVANILFYMRSLVSETRNFLDRLMAGLGTSDATAVADKIIAAINRENSVQEE